MMLGNNPLGRALHRIFPRVKIRIRLEDVGRALAEAALANPKVRGAALESIALKVLLEQFGEERREELNEMLSRARRSPNV